MDLICLCFFSAARAVQCGISIVSRIELE
jgi:hypothetical protein